MTLSKEMLLERRAALVADLNALDGAIQQLDWMLMKLDEEEDIDVPLGLDDSCDEA